MIEIQAVIKKLSEGNHLTEAEASALFQKMMQDKLTPAQMGGVLMAFRLKGETVDELTGAARAMRAACIPFKAPPGTLDTCGTGGDHAGTFNISTAAAFVVAGCGVPVAKHGNRSVTSRSGSAEVLKALGVNIEAPKETMEQALQEAGICFLLAPRFHPAMQYVAPVRQELGIRTIFNLVGPLANPAQVSFQLVGVFAKAYLLPLAEVLKRLGVKRAWVVHGEDGMDEMTTTAITHVAALTEGKITSFAVDPESAGIKKVKPAELKGGDPVHNAEALREVISQKTPGPHQDIVVLNAAAALVVAGKAKDIVSGVKQAESAIQEGRAREALNKLVTITQGKALR